MTPYYSPVSKLRQRGIASIFTALILVLLLGAAALASEKLAIQEKTDLLSTQAMTQAYYAAVAGLAVLVNNDPPSEDMSITLSASGEITGQSHISFTPQENDVIIHSRGSSPNGKYHYQSQQRLFKVALIRYLPVAQLVARGQIKRNAQTNSSTRPLTLWAGSDIVSCTGNITCIGNDAALSSLSSDALFNNFFTFPRSTMQRLSSYIDCRTTACTSSDIATLQSPVFIEGNITIDEDLGESIRPALLIISGNVKISDGAHFHGVIYIDNDWNATDLTGTIYGTVLVNGDINIAGLYELSTSTDDAQQHFFHYLPRPDNGAS